MSKSNTSMNRIFICMNFVFSTFRVNSQLFEGKVIYNVSFKSRMTDVTSEQWKSMIGTRQDYFIKNGSYKTITNGTLLQWQLYVNSENHLYNKMSNAEDLQWNDAAINSDSVLKSEVKGKVTVISGYSCDERILTCKSGGQHYFFSSKLPVDPKWFTRHQFGNWYAHVSIAKAIPIKVVVTYEQFEMVQTVVEIKPGKLSDNVFSLPAGAKSEKSTE